MAFTVVSGFTDNKIHSTLQPKVQTIPASVETAQEKGTLVMDPTSFAQANLSEGSIVVQEATPENPFGFVGRVSSIHQTLFGVVVLTEAPTLEEVYDEIDIDATFDLLKNGIEHPNSDPDAIPYTIEEYYNEEQGKTARRLAYTIEERHGFSASKDLQN